MTRLTNIFAVAWLLAMVLLVACAPGPEPPPIPTPAPTLAPDVLATYQLTGGIAGDSQMLTVYRDGAVDLVRRRGDPVSLQVDEQVLEPLRRMLAQDDFGDLEPRYLGRGADTFTYTIVARAPSGTPRSVTTMDLAEDPDYLRQLVNEFESLRRTVEQGG